MSDFSPDQQAYLDSFEQTHKSLLEKKSSLDTELLKLLAESNISAEQKARLSELRTEIAQVSTELAATRLDSIKAVDKLPSLSQVVNIIKDVVKQDSAKETILKIPPPPKGSVNIVHGTVQKNDMISYMKFTQYLNPYGRKRQCDIDLENLMAIINKDCNNQLAEYTKLSKEITSIVKG